MYITDILDILVRKLFVIILTILITMLVAGIGTSLLPPVYEATAILRISATTGGSLNYYDSAYIDRLFTTFVEIASSSAVESQLLNTLDVDTLPDISIEKIANSELFTISVEAESPKLAAASANALANILLENSKDYYIGDTKTAEEIILEQLDVAKTELDGLWQQYEAELLSLDPDDNIKADITREQLDEVQINYNTLLSEYNDAVFREEIRENSVSIVSPAEAPAKISSPNLSLNLAAGFIIGLVGGVALALVFENIDTTLNTDKAISASVEIPIFAQAPKTSKRTAENPYLNPTGKFAETFKKIANNVLYVSSVENTKTLLFTSTQKGEGKTTVIAHLGLQLAELGRRVLVIDGDFSSPSLHKYFNLPNEVGFSEVLEEKASIDTVILNSENENLKILPAGTISKNGKNLISSEKTAAVLKDIREDYDFILLDSPPMFPVINIAHMADAADGILVVIRRTHANQTDIADANKYLKTLKDKFTAAIFNQAQNASNNYVHY